ncbi:hypothetical protein JTB14_008961 [Gonioctena quinquepunctata]|nr:hypothetical protein JTB14_008961 [Gonioctena quinquepunctata]
MDQITNQELLCKLETIIKKNTSEIKAEIKSINDTLNQKLENLEKRYSKIEEKIVYIERENKKNNIVIFGITTDWENLLNTTLEQLNIIFGCELDERDINNIHPIGKKNTIIVEFILNLQKQKIFKHLYKLKGTGISITHDLRPEDRELNRNLVHHLKEARAKNQKAHIKNFKLFVNAVPYTIEELENPTDSLNIELESSLPKIQPKNKSAPSTPTTTHHSSKELEDTPSISEIPDVTEPQLKKQTTRTEILKHHIHENTESKSPITTKPSTINPNRNQPMKMKEIKETRSLRNKQTIN